MYTWHILCVILVVYTLKQNNICFWVFEHVLYFCMCLCVIFKGGWLAYFSLQLLITSFYHTASFSTHLMPCVCLHICMCLHVNVVMHICAFWPESWLRQGSDLFTPHMWSGLQTTAGSWGKAWNQMSSLFPSLPDDFANGSDCLY